MLVYKKVLQDSIEREIAGTDYVCIGEDKKRLSSMIEEINRQMGVSIRYLAELDAFHIMGAGEIIANYIGLFSSASVIAILLPQLVLDKVKDCDQIVFQLYSRFRESEDFISAPGKPAPAHIYVRYDNAFRSMKSKRIAGDLIKVVSSPRDAYYLPFTVKMLASWKVPELKTLLLKFSEPDNISMQDVGLEDNGQSYFPPFSAISRELRFSAIGGLRYYPCEETFRVLRQCLSDPNADIQLAAKRSLQKMKAGKLNE